MKHLIIPNKDRKTLQETYTWVADMQHVPQDARHHAEGDVWTHTQMVLDALENNTAFHALPEMQKEIVWTAALLHDVEKRSTTITEDDGSITSRNHARRGELTARMILYKEIPVSFAQREHIAALVRYHGLPLWIMEKPDPLKALAEASSRVDTRLLYLLACADMQGRICNDKQEMTERIEFFKAYCIEQDCWGTARNFSNGLARYHYFNHEASAIDYVPYNDTKCEVILLCALPGMGKDHYRQKYFPEYPIVSLDDIRRKHKYSPLDKEATGRVVQEAKEQARVYLRKGQSFVWNATNITRNMRSGLIELFTSYKAFVKIVYIEVPYRQWLLQNKNREYALPEVALEKMLCKLEVPLLHEAHERLLVVA